MSAAHMLLGVGTIHWGIGNLALATHLKKKDSLFPSSNPTAHSSSSRPGASVAPAQIFGQNLALA